MIFFQWQTHSTSGMKLPVPFSLGEGEKKKQKTHFLWKRFDHALNIRLYTSRNVNATSLCGTPRTNPKSFKSVPFFHLFPGSLLALFPGWKRGIKPWNWMDSLGIRVGTNITKKRFQGKNVNKGKNKKNWGIHALTMGREEAFYCRDTQLRFFKSSRSIIL